MTKRYSVIFRPGEITEEKSQIRNNADKRKKKRERNQLSFINWEILKPEFQSI